MKRSTTIVAALALLMTSGAACAANGDMNIQKLLCSGKVGTYTTGRPGTTTDRSIGINDHICYFISDSDAGKRILKTCKLGADCKVLGTVVGIVLDRDPNDWTPIIIKVDHVTMMAAPAISDDEGDVTKKKYTCSGKVGSYSGRDSVPRTDRSIGGGDSMCYFISDSDVGKKILKTCKLDTECEVLGTVVNHDAGDWSPTIIQVDRVAALKGG